MTFALWAAAVPDSPAIISDAGTRTFSQLNANANRLARALLARGIKAGDSVALVCSNRPESAEALSACRRRGLRCAPVNWHLTEDEAAYIIGDCEAKVLIADGQFAAAMRATVDRTRGLRVLLAIGEPIAGFEPYA